MDFYQSLQLDPIIMKKKIKAATEKKIKKQWLFLMILRSLLIVAFAILVIMLATKLFGMEMKAYAVVFFCMLMSLRFVDFGYKISQSMIGLGGVTLSLFILPYIQFISSATMSLIMYFILLSGILLVTASDPKMGNASLYGFSYIFIVYSTLDEKINANYFFNQALLFIVFSFILMFVLYKKHREKYLEKTFFDVWRQDKRKEIFQLLSYSLGISLLIIASKFLPFQRFMWIGFAFSSLYSSYGLSGIDVKERAVDRLIGTLVGSGLFIVFSDHISGALLSLLGGFALGICSSYRYKTVFNCFGALVIASELFGVPEAAAMRIIDNILGIVLAIIAVWIVSMFYRKMKIFRME